MTVLPMHGSLPASEQVLLGHLSLSEPAALPNPSSLSFLSVSLCLSVYFSLAQYLFLSLSLCLSLCVSLSLSHTAACFFLFSPLSLRFSLSLLLVDWV